MYLRDCHVVVFIQSSTHALCTASQRRAVLGDLFRVIDPRYELINMAEHVLKSSDGRLTTVMYNVYNRAWVLHCINTTTWQSRRYILASTLKCVPGAGDSSEQAYDNIYGISNIPYVLFFIS